MIGVKAIVLVSPNNPSGAVYPEALIARFHALACRHGLALVLDETYRDFLPPGLNRAHGLFAEPGWDANLVHLYSFSKATRSPGQRLRMNRRGAELHREAAEILQLGDLPAPFRADGDRRLDRGNARSARGRASRARAACRHLSRRIPKGEGVAPAEPRPPALILPSSLIPKVILHRAVAAVVTEAGVLGARRASISGLGLDGDLARLRDVERDILVGLGESGSRGCSLRGKADVRVG